MHGWTPCTLQTPYKKDRLKSLTKSGYFSVLLTGEMGTPGITCVFPDLLRVQGVLLAWLAYYRASMPSRYTRPSRAYPAWTHGRRVLLLRIDDLGKLRCGAQKQLIPLAIRMRCVCACACAPQIIHLSVLFCSVHQVPLLASHDIAAMFKDVETLLLTNQALLTGAVPCPAAQHTSSYAITSPLLGTLLPNPSLGKLLGKTNVLGTSWELNCTDIHEIRPNIAGNDFAHFVDVRACSKITSSQEVGLVPRSCDSLLAAHPRARFIPAGHLSESL